MSSSHSGRGKKGGGQTQVPTHPSCVHLSHVHARPPPRVHIPPCVYTSHMHTHPTRAYTPQVHTPHCAHTSPVYTPCMCTYAHAPHMCIPPHMWVCDGAGVLSPLAQVRESGDPLLVKSFAMLSLKLSSFFSHLAHCDSHLPPRNLDPEKPDSPTCCDPRSFGTQVSGPPSGIFRPNYRPMGAGPTSVRSLRGHMPSTGLALERTG